MSYKWLQWAKRIQAISQSGVSFTQDKFDQERYQELIKLSAEIIADYSDYNMEAVEQLFLLEQGYQTPKVDVRGVVFNKDKILLVKEEIDNKWSLPGGFCDVGLSPSENVIKEIQEEAGLEVQKKKLMAVYDMEKHQHSPQPYHYYKFFIHCEVLGGALAEGIETIDVDFFDENSLPSLSEGRNTLSQLKQMFHYYRNPEEPTYFD
ncbi:MULTISPECIES: NUDIX hydrolase [Oceanobacillus]|uniref:ADP-ribose pyrophosphatase YjhB n=1 Tax=Oceanobacillus kimchii TaxID=746691 RepID=A0ABQ5THL9_9BACI|nr:MULTISPECIES: NUDIX hydrolase [Oceanobacillus]MBT2598536.1 NUDIX hydrolase [Oceanobacillus sp. ISL-74]MBT2651454.1 NUDIX hydrolase [Oceanobacillus sp. ISL-73]GLO66366.1 putative ADP-ribose pyrophosphatase YjhB [Oceanobacillus kimchii]